MSPFAIFATILTFGYIIYYGYNISKDMYGKKDSSESTEEVLDVSDMLGAVNSQKKDSSENKEDDLEAGKEDILEEEEEEQEEQEEIQQVSPKEETLQPSPTPEASTNEICENIETKTEKIKQIHEYFSHEDCIKMFTQQPSVFMRGYKEGIVKTNHIRL